MMKVVRSRFAAAVPAVCWAAWAMAQEPAGGAAPRFLVETIAERKVDRLPEGPLYWRVEEFASAALARAAAGPYALAASASGRNWLFTLGRRRGGSESGRVVLETGPIRPPRAEVYLLRINRAGGPPGAATPVHTHPGVETIYVLSGRVTQRTPHGVQHAVAGTALNAHAREMVMQLASSGTDDLDQLVMFVVDANRPFSPPASFD